jgi:hypothetical protein
MAKGKSDSLWNGFGRQVGHVKKAVTADVTKKPGALPAQGDTAKPQAAAQQAPPPPPVPEPPKVIYRDEKAEEIELPDRPGVKLRRTVIDEVIVDEKGEVKPDENKHGV